MLKRGIFILLTLVLVLQFVSAVDTDIKIVTLSEHDLRLTFINPDAATEGGDIVIETQKLTSGELGEISTNFSTTRENFNLAYSLSKNGSAVLSDTIKDITAGETLHMLLIPGIVEITKNYTEPEILESLTADENLENNTDSTLTGDATSETNNSEIQTENIPKESLFKKVLMGFVSRISGFATSEEENESSSNFVYYGAGIFVVFLLMVFFIYSKRKNKNLESNGKRKFANDEDEIADAERKIEEAREEIDEVRGKTKSKEFLDENLDEMEDSK